MPRSLNLNGFISYNSNDDNNNDNNKNQVKRCSPWFMVDMSPYYIKYTVYSIIDSSIYYDQLILNAVYILVPSFFSFYWKHWNKKHHQKDATTERMNQMNES